MDNHVNLPEFNVVPGHVAAEILSRDLTHTVSVVRETYLSHRQGAVVNPDSYFLKFPDRPSDRIIALPAAVHDSSQGKNLGIKWISSFPGNINDGLPRASAVVLLNNPSNGFPIACIEASTLSAVRTAASALLAASVLERDTRQFKQVCIVGCGLIARNVIELFTASGWTFGSMKLFDLQQYQVSRFKSVVECFSDTPVITCSDLEDALNNSDLVVLTTTASTPYIKDIDQLKSSAIVLHLSLRDLDPDVIVQCNNVVDDLSHCLKAATSVHLAYLKQKNHDFVQYTLPDLLAGQSCPDRSRPTIFSPFGMGMLDINLAALILDTAIREGTAIRIPQFY